MTFLMPVHPLNKSLKIGLSFSLALLLTACFNNTEDLQAYITQVKARPPAPIEPIPEIKPYVRFIYPGHDIDPFDSKILAPDNSADTTSSIAPDPNRMPEFLESFPLDSLRMVGTVNQDNTLWTLIRIPDGAVHRVKTGNYMGKNYGKIVKIEERTITLQEIIENGFGGYKEQENSIALSEQKEKP